MSTQLPEMSSASKEALIHILKVAAFIVGSSVLPAVAAFYTHEPWFLAASPVINILASFLVKYSGIKKEQSAGSNK